MEEASRLCDRLIIMDHGEILVRGKPSDLIHEYAGYSVIEIAKPSDEVREFVRSKDLRHDDLGHRILIYGKEHDQLFDLIRERYCVENCSLRMSTLEDVFLRLTGRQLRE
jgi:lipooligosaccharide transport system ATP-binding protein